MEVQGYINTSNTASLSKFKNKKYRRVCVKITDIKAIGLDIIISAFLMLG